MVNLANLERIISLLFVIHFLCLPKENEPAVKRRKKRQPITRRFAADPQYADYLALLIKSGRFGKSILSAESFFPFFTVLLSFVKWLENINDFVFKT